MCVLGHFVLLTAVLLNGHVGVYGQQQSYAVMAPNTIRPNIDYLAAVTVLNIGGELQVCFIFLCEYVIESWKLLHLKGFKIELLEQVY